MIKLDDLLIFVTAADNGSLSAAARHLNLPPSLASTGLKRLETELGVRLLARSTRSLRLTPEGERYLQYARNVMGEVEAGRHAVARPNGIGGTVSLALPSDIGRNVLAPWLDEFQATHTDVDLQVRIGDRVTNLFSSPVDLAVRYGTPKDSTLIALPLAPDNTRVLCASPEYLARHKKLLSPHDLLEHNCLHFALSDTVHDRWMFYRDAQPIEVKVRGNRSSDDGELVRRWAVSGHGLAYKSRIDVLGDLRSGALQAALTEFEGEAAPLSLVCAHRFMLSPTINALRAFLHQQVALYMAEPV